MARKKSAIEEIVAEMESHEHELRTKRLTDENRRTDRKYHLALERIAQLESEIDAHRQIKEIHTFEIPANKGTDSEATAVVLASDWHTEERVDPATVNGKNRFTLKIASARMQAFFANTARLIAGKQHAIRIKSLILALLGDFISGYIHEELVETAQLPPVEAIRNVQNHIASGIEFLLRETDVNLVLPCHSGNHGRITRRVHSATEKGNSLEWGMYHNLAERYAGERRVRFAIAAGYHSQTNIHGFRIRFHHGHNIRYHGGVGGITIPVNKAIAQWNKADRVNLDAFGHFHQYLNGGYWICNGSLIGYSPYALSIKADYERPQQAFFLVHHKRRQVTDVCPVWLD